MRLLHAASSSIIPGVAPFVDLDSIREEPTTMSVSSSKYSFTGGDSDVFYRESESVTSPVEEISPLPCISSSIPGSPFKFMENLQRKRKSMFRRNQSSSSLLCQEKRRTSRRPSLPSIPPTIDEMSSSVGHARSRRPSLHTDWTNEHQLGGGGGQRGLFDNRIHHIDIDPPVNYLIAVFKELDDRKEDYVEQIQFRTGQQLYEVFEQSSSSVITCFFLINPLFFIL
ncbi:hypothetical protein CAEBREN_10659 [Caenorhabditis brenneri]|uniref:Uncharacterized protein n=1 Tax=Caenorhabditis brenneri TaxID=135651 RepID=G0NC07_CAEBE|nr:hypothetical protein CAEBREN_10659 [Caenorhabditis brenneri]